MDLNIVSNQLVWQEFHLSSFEGKVFIVKKEVEEIPDEPPKTYSLYGEDY